MIKYSVIIVLLLFLVSCRKFKFTDVENEMIQVYTVGDTLVFKSIKTGVLERFVIMNKNIDYSTNGALSFVRKHAAIVSYRDLKDPAFTNSGYQYNYMFSFVRSKKYNSIDFSFKYSDISCQTNLGIVNNTDTLYYLNKKIIDYYVLTDTINSDTLARIYWQKKYGIVKYDYRNGDSYVRINMP
jgi:hypothetical protein